MKSRITLRIGKILEALTAPAEHRAQGLGEGQQGWMVKDDTGRPCGCGRTVHRGQGLTNTALVFPWFSGVSGGRRVPAQLRVP